MADPEPDQDVVSHGAAAGAVGPATRHLAIVDANGLRRDCLKLALDRQTSGWQVSDVASAEELVRRRQGAAFDVVLLAGSTCADIALADIALLAAAAPRVPILVAADCEDPQRARLMLRCGARGFLPASLGFAMLMAALEQLCGGGCYIPQTLAGPAAGDAAATSPWRLLTRRQRDVLAQISEGKPNKRIAEALAMSESTVKTHVKQIIRRLNVANRTQAALLAARHGHGRSGEAAPGGASGAAG